VGFTNDCGLSEIENRRVLEQLISYTPLHKADYNIIHYESPDFRGIDVALLYRKSLFTPINHNIISYMATHLGTGTTRDVLYVWGRTLTGIHFIFT
jgi:hypothetical protein